VLAYGVRFGAERFASRVALLLKCSLEWLRSAEGCTGGATPRSEKAARKVRDGAHGLLRIARRDAYLWLIACQFRAISAHLAWLMRVSQPLVLDNQLQSPHSLITQARSPSRSFPREPPPCAATHLVNARRFLCPGVAGSGPACCRNCAQLVLWGALTLRMRPPPEMRERPANRAIVSGRLGMEAEMLDPQSSSAQS
jgi:hypothetical protein